MQLSATRLQLRFLSLKSQIFQVAEALMFLPFLTQLKSCLGLALLAIKEIRIEFAELKTF
ncbi:hypothetical protein D3854_03505 [Streptococcus mutans]|uniref:hypothetical protein n=1 Tax=Streptococcus mutans TaxID=1309 RepID=UPI0002B51AC6|nr:hypothetical protein [Streptococcus mutans]AMF85436.1 hypothetical protein APQ13_03040 [Streptococcus mutans]ARS62396.1 hypothetical protein RO10_03925 [Streptococcus mutans]EMB59700.1 hypothetical protein SMU20_04917 [Streptococcus mutans 15JP3]EMC01934.1 hypothetical protein SMU63_00520 [Streptococcus mutans T4]EMC11440.1 hypothetical protein SMU75_05579 [Streptococcus mutans N3209]